jgi:hypothetical protein
MAIEINFTDMPSFTPEESLMWLVSQWDGFEWTMDTHMTRRHMADVKNQIDRLCQEHDLPYPVLKTYTNKSHD